MFKRLRGLCLYEGCNEKATVFTKNKKGLCDEHYHEYLEIQENLENILTKLKKSSK